MIYIILALIPWGMYFAEKYFQILQEREMEKLILFRLETEEEIQKLKNDLDQKFLEYQKLREEEIISE